jgi:retron-type reverse transcriptase
MMDDSTNAADRLKTDLFRAYYDARKNKRNTINQMKFELNFEHELLLLYDEITNRTYKPRPSICFIVDIPVKREVFAADFRDRVIHHLLCGYINPVFENIFIEDSYSCRKGKGTLYGIRQIDSFIRECSENYTKDCYILKLDIRGYFMNINKNILAAQLNELLSRERFDNAYQDRPQPDPELIHYLINETIYQDVKENCIIKGNLSDWEGLPLSKSLFECSSDKGLPIGNLTSQLFSNVYMHAFDDYIKSELGIEYYGRYVDDFAIIHQDKEFLKKLILRIKDFLETNLRLELHPKKIYLQHYTKGVPFLGAVIKPHRIYVAKRTYGHFKKALHFYNCRMAGEYLPDEEELRKVRTTVNSYLGIMQHFNSYNMKKKILFNKPGVLFEYGYFTGHLNKYKLYKKAKKEMAGSFNYNPSSVQFNDNDANPDSGTIE